MSITRSVLALAAVGVAAVCTAAADKPKRVLLVTHSGGFIHDSVGLAEQVLKAIGPQNGMEVTCYRYTGDPNAVAKDKGGKEYKVFPKYQEDFRKRTGVVVGPEHCGRVNKDTLKNFDCVLFFTTGNPMTTEETKDLVEWVKAGGAFTGTHCATDTLYGDAAYGNLIGAYFRGHPPGLQDIVVKVEDPAHPAAAGFADGTPYKDEIYIFRDAPYSRDRLHVILSAAPGSFKPDARNARSDNDYAVSWCREEGRGKVFYTSLGHDKKVWQDERFQKHLVGGLNWAMGLAKGDATPSGKR